MKEVTSTEIWTLKHGLQRYGNLKINCLKNNVMNAKLIKSLSVFTDAELFEISRKYFGYDPNDICKVIDRIESAMYFGEFCLDDVIKEYGKTNLADERPERVNER